MFLMQLHFCMNYILILVIGMKLLKDIIHLKPKKHLKYHQKVLAHWNSNIIKYKEVKVAKLDNLESTSKTFNLDYMIT